MNYDGTPEYVHEFLLTQEDPMYHEEIASELNLPQDYVGQALMELYDADKVDWPAPDEWVALADEQKVIDFPHGKIRIGICHD